jgi:hypothetical protein
LRQKQKQKATDVADLTQKSEPLSWFVALKNFLLLKLKLNQKQNVAR